jgi:tetratricopeptide (TPR) repeat protein
LKNISAIVLVILLFSFGNGTGDAASQNDEEPNASDYRATGNAEYAKGNFDGSIAAYNLAIEIQPKYAKAYIDRAKAKYAEGNIDGAVADYDQAIQITPKLTQAYIDRGILKQDKGDLEGAVADYQHSIALEPENPVGYNNVAWILATASDSSERNGPKAIDYAMRACETAGWANTDTYGTVAAAYAESGDFDQALKWQSKYIESHPKSRDAQSYLALYKNHQPYHGTKSLLATAGNPKNTPGR